MKTKLFNLTLFMCAMLNSSFFNGQVVVSPVANKGPAGFTDCHFVFPVPNVKADPKSILNPNSTIIMQSRDVSTTIAPFWNSGAVSTPRTPWLTVRKDFNLREVNPYLGKISLFGVYFVSGSQQKIEDFSLLINGPWTMTIEGLLPDGSTVFSDVTLGQCDSFASQTVALLPTIVAGSQPNNISTVSFTAGDDIFFLFDPIAMPAGSQIRFGPIITSFRMRQGAIITGAGTFDVIAKIAIPIPPVIELS
jgi:hypothetical protein